MYAAIWTSVCVFVGCPVSQTSPFLCAPASMEIEQVKAGFKLPVRRQVDGVCEVLRGEVVGTEVRNERRMFYIHYIDFNRRLDEWG